MKTINVHVCIAVFAVLLTAGVAWAHDTKTCDTAHSAEADIRPDPKIEAFQRAHSITPDHGKMGVVDQATCNALVGAPTFDAYFRVEGYFADHADDPAGVVYHCCYSTGVYRFRRAAGGSAGASGAGGGASGGAGGRARASLDMRGSLGGEDGESVVDQEAIDDNADLLRDAASGLDAKEDELMGGLDSIAGVRDEIGIGRRSGGFGVSQRFAAQIGPAVGVNPAGGWVGAQMTFRVGGRVGFEPGVSGGYGGARDGEEIGQVNVFAHVSFRLANWVELFLGPREEHRWAPNSTDFFGGAGGFQFNLSRRFALRVAGMAGRLFVNHGPNDTGAGGEAGMALRF